MQHLCPWLLKHTHERRKTKDGGFASVSCCRENSQKQAETEKGKWGEKTVLKSIRDKHVGWWWATYITGTSSGVVIWGTFGQFMPQKLEWQWLHCKAQREQRKKARNDEVDLPQHAVNWGERRAWGLIKNLEVAVCKPWLGTVRGWVTREIMLQNEHAWRKWQLNT